MRASAVVSEAARDIAAGTSAAGVLALLLGVLTAGLVALDAQAVLQLRRQVAAFAAADAAVRILTAQGRIDPIACDRLARTAPIRRAGALAATTPVTLLAAPAQEIPAYRVTPGLGGVLGVADAGRAGVWITRDLARTLAVAPGGSLATTAGPLTVAGLVDWPDDGRDARLAYAVLEPVALSASAMDECWAAVWPTTDAADEVLRSAAYVASSANDPMTVGRVNNTLGTGPDALAAFRARPTRLAVPGCLGAGFLLAVGAVRRRRLEYAAARHSGQRRPAQTATALLEAAVWSLGGLVVAAVLLTLVLRADRSMLDVLALDLRGPLLAVLGAQLGTLAALALVHEDHLFRYVKDR